MRSKIRNSVISIGSVFLSIFKFYAIDRFAHAIGFASILTVVLLGCGKNTTPEDHIPPAKPVLLPLATYTTTSDSVCGPYDQGANAANGFRLMWQPSTDADLASWQIYFRRAYSNDTPILLGTHSAQTAGTEYIVNDARILPDNHTDSTTMFEYWVNAVDQTGNVSIPSDVVRFRMLRKAEGVTVLDTITGLPTFTGQYSLTGQYVPDRYSIKVRSGSTLVWLYSSPAYQNQVNVRFNDNGTAIDSFLTASGHLRPGSYDVSIEFWYQDSAGSIASLPFGM